MREELLCPSCHQSVEAGASFCGNCGQQLVAGSQRPIGQVAASPAQNSQGQSTIANVYANTLQKEQVSHQPNQLATAGGNTIPAYAVAQPIHKHHWAAMAIAFAILGIGGSLLVPIIGIGFGITGIVLVTTSFQVTGKALRLASLILSVLALMCGIAAWIYAYQHDPRLHPNSNVSQAATNNGVATINVTTPCYSLKFTKEFNVDNSSGSCAINAYNGVSITSSTEVYKVVVSQSSNLTDSNFSGYAKQAIENDVAKNLPGFSITNEASDLFQGSIAYYAQAANTSANISVVEEAIFHPIVTSQTTSNLFVIVHAVNGTSVNLNDIEKSWQWNE